MNKIKLLYAKNIISRKGGGVRQELSFLALVENLAFAKSIDVLWAGEDSVWRVLPAAYHRAIDEQKEYWFARTTVALADNELLPGNVLCAVRYRAAGAEYWDNNHGENYSIQADSGIRLTDGYPLLNVESESCLSDGQSLLPIVVAVESALQARKMTVHWTSDDWQSKQQTACHFRRGYWNSELLSNARNPNHYGCQVWQAVLKAGEAFQIQYRISCETRQQALLDDNFGQNYTIQRRPLTVMVLNLHCRQEDDQDFKLSQIARAIDDLHVDLVCLQEVAELWNDGKGDWQTNTARIINEHLESPYHLVTDWSHLGFERYREGVAVLSRYPIEKQQARYVSASEDPYSIHSRKVVMAQVKVPYFGRINVFSSHLSWWEDGFAEQFDNLRRWAADEHRDEVVASLLGGDFNIKAGAKGYQRVVDSNEYEDQYLAATSPQIFRRIFAARELRWKRYLDEDQRIDYVFLRKGSALRVTSGRVVFTEEDYGSVSDHVGYVMTFEPA